MQCNFILQEQHCSTLPPIANATKILCIPGPWAVEEVLSLSTYLPDKTRFHPKSLFLSLRCFITDILAGIFLFHFLSEDRPGSIQQVCLPKDISQIGLHKVQIIVLFWGNNILLTKTEREKLKSLQIEIHSYICYVVLLNGSIDGSFWRFSKYLNWNKETRKH